MRNLIKGTTLIISHQEKILKIADEVILMKEGKIVKIEESQEFLKNNLVDNAKCCKINKNRKD